MPDSRQAAAAEFGEKPDGSGAHGGRLAEQPRHHDAVHQRDAGVHATWGFEERARFLEVSLRLVPHADDGGERIGRAEARALRRLALDLEGIGPHQPPGSTHGPRIEQQARLKALARGGAAQHHHFGGEQRATGRDVGHGTAFQPRALKDDGLLRQPVECGAFLHAHGDIDGARTGALGGAVDLLGGLGSGDGRRAGAKVDGHLERIAAGHPARRGDQHRQRRLAGLGLWEQNPAGIALIEIAEPGAALPQIEGDAAFAAGALQKGGGGRHRAVLDRTGMEMSKAFTKESDGEDDDDLPDEISGLPAGAKNYMTPQGFERLREELMTLMRKERPEVVQVVSWAAANGDRSENGDYLYGKKRLREIDRRIRFLSKRLERSEVVDPAKRPKTDQVFFGATVAYANSKGEERTVKIVGVDEVDPTQGHVSWISPIARALTRAFEGDVVKMRTPGGEEEIEIVKVEYV